MSHVESQHHAVVIGIGGGTGSGKTTFASRIIERVGEHRIALIRQADIIIPGGGYNDVALDMVAARIADMLRANP